MKLESGADGAEPYGYKDENGRVRVNEAAFSRPDDDEIARMLTGWQKDDGKWYLLSDSGRMLKGWQKDEGSWYHMADAGGAMDTGWLRSGGEWYYLSTSGEMTVGWEKIRGK